MAEERINVKPGIILLAEFRKNLDRKHQGFDGFQTQQHHRFLGTADFARKPKKNRIDHLQYFGCHAEIFGNGVTDFFDGGIFGLHFLNNLAVYGGQAGQGLDLRYDFFNRFISQDITQGKQFGQGLL